MATNKNRVNAYVDDIAFEVFKEFCSSWQVSHSRGVELLIKQFLIESNVSGALLGNVKGNVDNTLLEDKINQALETERQEFKQSLLEIESLFNQKLSEYNKRLEKLESLKNAPQDIEDDEDDKSTSGITKKTLEPILKETEEETDIPMNYRAYLGGKVITRDYCLQVLKEHPEITNQEQFADFLNEEGWLKQRGGKLKSADISRWGILTTKEWAERRKHYKLK